MKIEEAIVYVLASSGHGMKTEQIAREINERKLFTRWDKAPVDGKMVYAARSFHPLGQSPGGWGKMVYAVVMSHPDTFCKSEGRIRLII